MNIALRRVHVLFSAAQSALIAVCRQRHLQQPAETGEGPHRTFAENTNVRHCQTAGFAEMFHKCCRVVRIIWSQNTEFLFCQFSVDRALGESLTFTDTASNPRIGHEPVWRMNITLNNVCFVLTSQKTHCAHVIQSSRTVLLRAIFFCNPAGQCCLGQ